MKKNRVKILLFLAIFVILFLGLSQIFKNKLLAKPWDTTIKINGLYNEDKNTFDIMFAGTSHMYCSVIPTQLEKETGLKGYIFTTSQQPIWITYFYIQEFLKYQTPRLVVLDVRELALEENYAAEAPNRTALDHLRPSFLKMEAIRVSVPKEERASFYIPFIKYHSRWKELQRQDFTLDYLKKTDTDRGFVRLTSVATEIKQYDLVGEEKQKPIPEKSLEYLDKIVEILQNEGIELLLIKSPSNPNEEEQMLYRSVQIYAEDNNLTFLNFNHKYEEIGLDLKVDFYDQGHLNEVGAAKFTSYIGKIISTMWEE